MLYVDAVIGFNQCEFTFQEGDAEVVVPIQVLSGTLERSVQVNIFSLAGNAEGKCTSLTSHVVLGLSLSKSHTTDMVLKNINLQ